MGKIISNDTTFLFDNNVFVQNTSDEQIKESPRMLVGGTEVARAPTQTLQPGETFIHETVATMGPAVTDPLLPETGSVLVEVEVVGHPATRQQCNQIRFVSPDRIPPSIPVTCAGIRPATINATDETTLTISGRVTNPTDEPLDVLVQSSIGPFGASLLTTGLTIRGGESIPIEVSGHLPAPVSVPWLADSGTISVGLKAFATSPLSSS